MELISLFSNMLYQKNVFEVTFTLSHQYILAISHLIIRTCTTRFSNDQA